MIYLYLFIFWKNKYLINPNFSFLNSCSNNEIIMKKDEFLLNNKSVLYNSTNNLSFVRSYLNGDGTNNCTSEKELNIDTFIQNKKKLAILNTLLSNSSSTSNKLSLISSIYKRDNLYSHSLFAGGLLKDSDFEFF